MRTHHFRTFALGIGFSLAFSAAFARSEGSEHELNIQSLPLDDALQEFARQSGVQIVFVSRIAEGLVAPPLQGRFTTVRGLQTLLEGTDLRVQKINERTFAIRPPAPGSTAVPTAEARALRTAYRSDPAQRDPSTMEQVIVRGVAEQLVATRTETPLRSIPQTVSIISSEQIQRLNDTNLDEALSHAPGITLVRQHSLNQELYARGFQITSFHVDGGAALHSFNTATLLFLGSPDLSEIDHIEVLRGADGLFASNGNPGATVSMVRKRPQDAWNFNVDLMAGSWDKRRAQVDLTGPLTQDGAVRGRIVGVYADQDYFYENANLTRRKVSGSLDFDPGPSTRLTMGGAYQRDDALPFFGGLPRHTDGSDPHLPRSTSLTFNWSDFELRKTDTYLQLHQSLGDDWLLRFNGTYLRASVKYAAGFFDAPVDPVTKGLLGQPATLISTAPNTQDQLGLDITLSGSMKWLGLRNEVAIGADHTRFESERPASFGFMPFIPMNALDYDPAAFPDPRQQGGNARGIRSVARSRQGGVFGSLRLYLGDSLSLIGGLRIGNDRIKVRTITSFGDLTLTDSASDRGNDSVVTPYGGIIQDVGDHYSLYASYAEIYSTSGDFERQDGRRLGPLHGVNQEVGVKGAWREGSLNGLLAVYRIRQFGVPIEDPTGPLAGGGRLGCCFVPAAHRSEGVDLELAGSLAQRWLFGGGYSYNRNHSAEGGELSSRTPRHLLKFWTGYQLPGAANRWNIGGSAHVQSRVSQRGLVCSVYTPTGICRDEILTYKMTLPTVYTVDLRAAYDVTQNWKLALTVSNLFDLNYYETVGSFSTGNWYAPPRAYLLRVSGNF